MMSDVSNNLIYNLYVGVKGRHGLRGYTDADM